MKHLILTTIAAVLLVGCGEVSNPEADRALFDALKRRGNIEAVKQAIADGADLNAMGDEGETPLHQAALGGHKEVAELLIGKDADVNAKGDDSGVTPLHFAALEGQKEMAELLMAKGTDVNAKGDDGKTPLDRAIRNDETETADLLRKHGGKTSEELKAEGK